MNIILKFLTPIILLSILSVHSCANDELKYQVYGNLQNLAEDQQITITDTYQDLQLSSNGNFAFTKQYSINQSYQVKVTDFPLGQLCKVHNSQGVVLRHIYEVDIQCYNMTRYYAHSKAIKVMDVNFTKDLLLTASEDKTVLIWDLYTSEVLSAVSVSVDDINVAALNNNGDAFAVGTSSGWVYIWSIDVLGELKASFKVQSEIKDLQFSADDLTLSVLSASSYSAVNISDVDDIVSNNLVSNISVGKINLTKNIVFMANDQGHLLYLDLNTNTTNTNTDDSSPIVDFQLDGYTDSDRLQLAVKRSTGDIEVWLVNNGQLQRSLQKNYGDVTALGIDAADNSLLLAIKDKGIQAYDLTDEQLKYSYDDVTTTINQLQAIEHFLVVAGEDLVVQTIDKRLLVNK